MSESQRLAYLDIPSDEIRDERTTEREADIDYLRELLQKERQGFIEVNEIIGVYESNSEKVERQEACRSIIRKFFSDPTFLENFYVQLESQRCIRDGRYAVDDSKLIDRIIEDVDSLMVETIKKEKNLRLSYQQKNADSNDKPEYAERTELAKRWLEILVLNQGLSERVANILNQVFESSKGVEEYVRNLHVFAHGTILQSDNRCFAAGFNILNFQTSVLEADDRKLDLFMAGMISPDDEVNKRAVDVDFLLNSFDFPNNSKPTATELYHKYEHRMIEAYRNESNRFDGSLYHAYTMKSLEPHSREGKIIRRNIRLVQLRNNLDRADERALDGLSDRFFAKDGKMTKMRRALNRMVARALGKNVEYDPEFGELLGQSDTDSRFLLKKFLECHEQTVQVDSVFESIGYILPALSEDELYTLPNRVLELREKIQNDARYLVSPRGDKLVIDDPNLRELGITSIHFRPKKSVIDMDVILRVGNVDCVLHLDESLILSSHDTGQQLEISNESFVKVSELIFSHLHHILCEKIPGDGSTNSDESGFDSHVKVRRAHLRHLPKGYAYTAQQAVIALKNYGVNLAQYNLLRKLSKSDGQYTLVTEAGASFEEAQKFSPVVTRVSGASVFGKK